MIHLFYKPTKTNLPRLYRRSSTESSKKGSSENIKPILFVVFLLVSLFSDQQSYGQAAETNEWKLLKEIDGIVFYYSIGTCSSQKYMLLKVKNTKSHNALISWNLIINEEGSKTYSTDKMPSQAMLSGQELTGNCETISPFLNIPISDSFSDSNIVLTATAL